MSNRHSGEQGFTLVEMLATVVILAMFVSVLVTIMNQLLLQAKIDQEKEAATSLARSTMAGLVHNVSNIVGNQSVFTSTTTQPSPMSNDPTSYTVKTTISSVQPGLYEAEVTVTWPVRMDGVTLGGGLATETINLTQYLSG